MTTRKDFLATSLLTASLGGDAIAQAGAAPIPQFDDAHFQRILAHPARHKHMFAAGSINGGAIVTAMFNTYYVYEKVLRTRASDVFMAGVLYHGLAVALALNDRAWNDVMSPALSSFPPAFRSDVESLRPTSGNPMLRGGSNAAISGLVSRGAVFFVCRNALTGVAGVAGNAIGRAAADVYTELSRNLIPGATIVPTGVWAIHALQEAHFTYLQTSL